MNTSWTVVYWSSFLLGSLVIPFFQHYWTAGHFSFGSRFKFALVKLFWQTVLYLVSFLVLVIIGSFVMKKNFFVTMNDSILLTCNIYGMVVLVLLLSYGLAFLPYQLWHKIDSKSVLYETLAEADDIYKAYRDARVDFHTEVSICQNLITNNTTGFNREYMEILQNEIPTEDLDGDTIHTSRQFMVEVKKGKSVDESFIAARRNALKIKFFLYKRKKARWQSTFTTIQALTVEPKTIDAAYLGRRIDLQLQKSELTYFVLNLRIQQARKSGWYKFGWGCTAIVAACWSLFLLVNETKLIFKNHSGFLKLIQDHLHEWVFLNFFITIFFVCGMVGVSFLTIFKLKFSDYLQLVPGHTDCVTFCSFTGLIQTLI